MIGAVLLVSACTPVLKVPAGAQIACGFDFDCPAGHACAASGRCLDLDGPCSIADGDDVEAAADGLPCQLVDGGDGMCVSGACISPFCGDGFVDVAVGEACDLGAANSDREPGRCRTDCSEPRCGDGVVDGDEGCDDDGNQCVACQQVCITGTGDCDNGGDCECDLRPLAGLDINRVFSMGMDDAFVYLGVTGPAFESMGLLRVDLADGNVRVLVDEGADVDELVVGDTVIAFRSGTGLFVVDKDGGAPTKLDELFYDLAIDGDDVYTFDDEDGVLLFRDARGPAEQIGPAIRGVTSGAVIDGVAWASTGAGDVVRVREDAVDVVATRQFEVTGVELAADGGALWWMDERGQILRLSPDGGGAIVVARSPPNLDGRERQGFSIHEGDYVWRATSAVDLGEVLVGGRPPSGPRMRAEPASVIDTHAVHHGVTCFSSFDEVFCLR